MIASCQSLLQSESETLKKQSRKIRRDHDRIRARMRKQQRNSTEPVSISDEEVVQMQERTDQRVFELITARMVRFFGEDMEDREEEVTRRTAIFRKKGAALLMIDGQPALEVKAPQWIPSADGVDCHIEYKEYEVNGATQYLKN